MKLSLLLVSLAASANALTTTPQQHQRVQSTTALNMGLFDNWKAQGSGKDELDDQWEQQQEILKLRRKPQAQREAYFASVEDRREKASQDFKDKWAWQSKRYGKGEDPLTEWKKRRADGTISDLENQYGDPKEIGGIPLPMASFGVGGEFGLGGKFDNGGRFDLRLPYADQGYVDEDSDVMGKLGNFFGGGKKKEAAPPKPTKKAPEPKKNKWPWEQ
mmetsp:Transcript_31069/g.51324  ORF Transcript_31069/g.51324 Transcript_31069/m.51324 type:complete len:217 (+) Transcript_31069:95-745(+)|eukprot:CAMPEP_0119016806 /NCGR_PEP_ID=MMETSP1176-20130426/14489_1 /TAXON_ID=265551 /ORGANISM="Synedropsis recta cf, Strain CCMP1620" /LENGTH=216 /DNA_ID=CAMNT_0006970347 /DNA_START=71 /DNA_END=721 /DNA_ORIENTATION=+